MLRIGIADDLLLFRKSLIRLISTFDSIEVVLEADNGLQLLEKLQDIAIDVLLLDIHMPEMDGYQACMEIRLKHPYIKILIVSQFVNEEAVAKVIEMGAHGFFSKNFSPDQLYEAIFNLYDKDFHFVEEIASIIKEPLVRDRKKARSLPKVIISQREIEVIKLACKEYSSSEIADKLCITPRTVDSHRKRIMERTNSKNFIGVILFALKHGLVRLEDL